MVTIKNYLVAKDLEEAYEVLNANKKNVVLGGMLWLKMCKKNIHTAVDLSQLGLNEIVETEDTIEIGCMTSLRQLEKSELLQNYFGGVISKCVKHIVGTQFRNTATVGGSLFARFGFSDVLTTFLALDTYVLLHKEGLVDLETFIQMPREKDILVKVIVKKDGTKASYTCQRNAATDLPNLVVCVGEKDGQWKISVGARPHKAKLAHEAAGVLSERPTEQEIEKASQKVIQELEFESNLRASGEYREVLAQVLVKRAIEEICTAREGHNDGN